MGKLAGSIITLLGIGFIYLYYAKPTEGISGALADFASIWVGAIVVVVGLFIFFHKKKQIPR